MAEDEKKRPHEPTPEDRLYETINRAISDALDRHERNREGQKSHVLEAILAVCCLFLFLLAFDYLSYAPWINSIRYSIWFHVDSAQVKQLEDKPPTDCDFLTSPIGKKGCHYKKHVDLTPASPDNDNKASVIIYWSRENGN